MDEEKTSKRNTPRKPILSVVVPFPEDRVVRDRSVENALRRARRAKLEQVLIIGYTEEGGFYATSSALDRKDALWLIETQKLDLFNMIEWIDNDDE